MNPTGQPVGPTEAADALALSRRRQREAIAIAYDTPWWYFGGIGAALAVLSVPFFADVWIETHLGRFVSLLTYVVGIAVFAAALGGLLAAVTVRQRTQPAKPTEPLGSGRAIVGAIAVFAVTLGVLWALAYAVLGQQSTANGTVLVITAVAAMALGRPLQKTLRDRVLKRRGLDKETP